MRDPALLESIRQSLDIVQFIGEVVPLEKRGHNHFGCCPFHQEKTPSFSVSSDKQLFHCFGCKAGGDIFKFGQLYYKWEFPQAVEELARRAGIQYEKSKVSDSWKESLSLLHEVGSFYSAQLESPKGQVARNYLEKRKIPEHFWTEFNLGYHPGGYQDLVNFLDSKSLSRDIAARLGLIGKAKTGNMIDRFRGRLIFSIADERGQIRGFGARALGDEQPKYINSPNSSIFDKSRLLYGMHLATESIRKKNYVVIVEGYLDVLALHEFGIRNVVCPMGTALTLEQVRQIKRWTHRVVCLFDADQAGLQATERNLEHFLSEGMESKVATLPGAKDPDAFLHSEALTEAQKREQLSRSFKSASFALDYLIEKSVLSESDSIQRAKRLRKLVELLDKVPDGIERGLLKREIAKRFELPMELFSEETVPHQPQPRSSIKPVGGATNWDREILKFLVIWGKSDNFGLTDVLPYLSFPTKWSKLLGDLIRSGLDSGQIADLKWLEDVDTETQASVREWVLEENTADNTRLGDIWTDLLKRLRNSYFKHQSLRLQSEIVVAENEGNEDRLTQLLAEKQDLARMLKSLE